MNIPQKLKLVAPETIAESKDAKWSYSEAFSRNLGLVNETEQKKIRNSHVAIIGMGGVGGGHLIALVRLGVENFTIADPDTFEIGNSNRQYGAMSSNYGKPKAEVMAKIAKDINPNVNIKVFAEHVTDENIDNFLEGADIFVDAVDAFVIDIRMKLFMKAYQKNIYSMSAGPFGFSTGWVIFDPKGMSPEQYFDIKASTSELEKFAAFLSGMAPKASHRSYLDLNFVSFKEQRGPSLGLACFLASGVVASEVTKMILGRGRILAAPHFHQFDPYLNKYFWGRLLFGNRGPLQRIKRFFIAKKLKQIMFTEQK